MIILLCGFLQAYIEAENMRLESEPCQFSPKEIIIRVEYKYCPNLTIIDTPGLIAPAPGRKNRDLQVNHISQTLLGSMSLLPHFVIIIMMVLTFIPGSSSCSGVTSAI